MVDPSFEDGQSIANWRKEENRDRAPVFHVRV